MKLDLEAILATLSAQTFIGLVFDNWIAGACAMIGLFIGIALAKAPANIRQFLVPGLMAIAWAFAGPALLK